MTLTVRLDAAMESALESYCASNGVTKSHVVQESLAQYLLKPEPRQRGAALPAGHSGPASASFLAFQRAGLIGGATLEAQVADKAAVRRRAVARSGTR